MSERRRRFAEDTSVNVSRTRGEIDKLLRAWGADAIRWTDSTRPSPRATLEFLWRHEDADYLARFAFDVEEPGRREHRLLLLLLKAVFNAVEDGLIEAEAIFLPFLVGADGQTVAQAALPRLRKLLEGSARLLLGDGDG